MAQGRCAGCGLVAAARKVASHTASCDSYLALWRSDRSKALAPEAEYSRFLAYSKSEEGRAEAESAMLARWDTYKFEGERRVSLAQDRWRSGRPGSPIPVSFPSDGSVFGMTRSFLEEQLNSTDSTSRQRVIAAASLRS